MQTILTRPRLGRAGIVQLPVDEIDPNPNQPRREFDEAALAELSASIAEYGVISPLTVRLHFGRYELVAGERRLRAARLAGLRKVPCIVLDVDMEESSLLAMVENLQRQDLDFLEEARGMANLMRMYGLSQEDCARRLGRSQSAVANKLRLLKLSANERRIISENGLTERHARALLKLDTPEKREEALSKIVRGKLNVERTEQLIDSMNEYEKYKERIRKGSVVFKDLRLFMNTVNKAVETMQIAGVDVNVDKKQSEDYLDYHIRIPLKKK